MTVLLSKVESNHIFIHLSTSVFFCICYIKDYQFRKQHIALCLFRILWLVWRIIKSQAFFCLSLRHLVAKNPHKKCRKTLIKITFISENSQPTPKTNAFFIYSSFHSFAETSVPFKVSSNLCSCRIALDLFENKSRHHSKCSYVFNAKLGLYILKVLVFRHYGDDAWPLRSLGMILD